MQLLHASDYRRMPWKNGGGETREILISPPGATLDTLDWRISLATIASDGPFSAFAGIQRTLCVIRGAGIRLQVGETTPELLIEHSPPYTFAGEATASCSLVAGPTVDLNVMSRRSRFTHTVKRFAIAARMILELRASATIVFCQSGSLQCKANGTSAPLGPEDCMVFHGEPSAVDLSTPDLASIIVIELFEEPAILSS